LYLWIDSILVEEISLYFIKNGTLFIHFI
jgi:hypothetical protein